MKNIKNGGKRLLAMVLSLIMCFGLLQVTAFAANWNPGDKITINVRVFDQSTGKVYNVGTDSVEKGNPELIQSVKYQIPQLTKFVSASQFGRVVKVAGNWYFPAGDSQPGANVEWSCNTNSVTMTYWVDWYKTGSGSGSGSNQDTTVNIGSGGRYSWTQYITYHSNYPDGTSYSYKVTYNIQSYTATYNDWSCIKSLADVKFSTPNGYEAKSPVWNTAKTGTGTGYAPNSQYTFQQSNNGKNLDLYAQWQPTGGTPVETVTLTFMDGDKVYGTQEYFVGETATAVLCTTDKAGYTFKGWDTVSAATTVVYLAGATFTIDKDTILYAVWEADAPAHSVTRGDDGSMILMKRFSGTDMPEDFFMYYEVTNAATGTIYNSDILTFTKVANGAYRANVTYPTWVFTGEWTLEEKQAYDSIITFTEYGTEVDGMKLTITAAGATVDNEAQTITFTADAESKNVGMKTITNTYTSSSVTPDTPKLTGFTKERLTTVPTELDLTGINTDATVNLKVGETATLLYAITVTGDEGANYIITDPTADPVDESAMTGTIGSSKEATVYVTKTIDIYDVNEGSVENIAYVQAGMSTDPIPGTNPGETTSSDPAIVQVNGELVVTKDKVLVEGGIDYTVRVNNQTGWVKGYLELKDSMDEGLVPITDGASWYTLTLYDKDGNEYEPADCDVSVDGQTITWGIDTTFEVGAALVLTYSVRIPENVEVESATNHIHVDTWNASSLMQTIANSDDVMSGIHSGDASCTVWFSQHDN